MSKLSKTEIADFDKWIEVLKQCQPLEECQVKILCEKVIQIIYIILKNFYNINIYLLLIIGKRSFKTRTKCTASKGSSNSMWRYSWTIFRFG